MRVYGGELAKFLATACKVLIRSRNAEFLEEMIANPVFAEMMADEAGENLEAGRSHAGQDGLAHEHEHGHSHDHGHEYHDPQQPSAASASSGSASSPFPAKPVSRGQARHTAQDKVRSTLRSFVRDWSDEGSAEREGQISSQSPCAWMRARKNNDGNCSQR
jgi:carnosine N-methyltransferase